MSQPLNIESLEARIAKDPSAAGFGTLAEVYRRMGRPDDARRVAIAGLAVAPEDTEGRLALGLCLLDLGEPAAARYELERAMAAVTGGAVEVLVPPASADATFAGDLAAAEPAEVMATPVVDAELDAAFATAEPLTDEMHDANDIAEQAMRQEQLDAPEGFQLDEVPAFATETMARLLDEQGDGETAETIRRRLQGGSARAGMDAASLPPVTAQQLGAAINGARARRSAA